MDWTIGVPEPFFDLRTYGAVGDGETDDTDAILAALDDAAEAGGTLFLPEGVWLTDYLDVPHGVTVLGTGDASVLKLRAQTFASSADEGGVLQVFGTEANPIRVALMRFKVDGNRDNITVSGGSALNHECIDLDWAQGCLLYDISTVDAVADGIDVDRSEHNLIVGCRADNCGGWGIHLSSLSFENRVLSNFVTNCGFSHSRGGIDQFSQPPGGDNHAARNVFIGNTVRDCYRNWQVESSSEYGATATWIGNQSLGTTTEDDVLTGVSDFGGPDLADTVEAETTFGLSPDAGASLEVSRADHRHGTPEEGDHDTTEAASLVTIPAAVYTDHGDELEVQVETVWGIDADGPYFDPDGAQPGEEAALRVDSDTGELVVASLAHFD